MKTYTLHVAADAAPGDAGTLERAVLVKDGFSWGAFVFSFFWFFAHRLWIAGLIVLIAAAALGAALQLLRVGRGRRRLGRVPVRGAARARGEQPAPLDARAKRPPRRRRG